MDGGHLLVAYAPVSGLQAGRERGTEGCTYKHTYLGESPIEHDMSSFCVNMHMNELL